jgi:hypothetical protein
MIDMWLEEYSERFTDEELDQIEQAKKDQAEDLFEMK